MPTNSLTSCAATSSCVCTATSSCVCTSAHAHVCACGVPVLRGVPLYVTYVSQVCVWVAAIDAARGWPLKHVGNGCIYRAVRKSIVCPDGPRERVWLRRCKVVVLLSSRNTRRADAVLLLLVAIPQLHIWLTVVQACPNVCCNARVLCAIWQQG